MVDDHLRGVRLPPELQGVPSRPLEVGCQDLLRYHHRGASGGGDHA